MYCDEGFGELHPGKFFFIKKIYILTINKPTIAKR